jgi:hypothetical protein
MLAYEGGGIGWWVIFPIIFMAFMLLMMFRMMGRGGPMGMGGMMGGGRHDMNDDNRPSNRRPVTAPSPRRPHSRSLSAATPTARSAATSSCASATILASDGGLVTAGATDRARRLGRYSHYSR